MFLSSIKSDQRESIHMPRMRMLLLMPLKLSVANAAVLLKDKSAIRILGSKSN